MNYTNKYIKYKTKWLKLQKIGGTTTDADVIYQDDDVCILRPEVKKGVLLFHHFASVNVCEEGLKTGQLLHSEGVDFERHVYHPYSFFRAPYYSNEIDYTSVETEIKSLYGDIDMRNLAFIRVNPSQTFTYSSEIRAEKDFRDPYYHNFLMNSRKSLTDYLRIIAENERIKRENPYSQHVYNLYTSRIDYSVPYQNKLQINNLSRYVKFPKNLVPVERNSEVLVRLPHIPNDFFVVCDYTAETKDDDIYKFS